MSLASPNAVTVFKIGFRSDRGQATIEFALVIIFLMIMVLSIVEMIFFMNTYNVLADSAKEGVRYAIVHGTHNSQPSGPTCPCAPIAGPPAPAGTVPGSGRGYGARKPLTHNPTLHTWR